MKIHLQDTKTPWAKLVLAPARRDLHGQLSPRLGTVHTYESGKKRFFGSDGLSTFDLECLAKFFRAYENANAGNIYQCGCAVVPGEERCPNPTHDAPIWAGG